MLRRLDVFLSGEGIDQRKPRKLNKGRGGLLSLKTNLAFQMCRNIADEKRWVEAALMRQLISTVICREENLKNSSIQYSTQ